MKDLKEKFQSAFSAIDKRWDESIIPTLYEYIKIPNKSVMFDKNWEANGYMIQAMQLIVDWCQQHSLKDMKLELLNAPNRTPLLFIEIPGQSDETVLFYGHMDKQPEMRGWDEDKGPWQPVIEEGKLYGRGGADDGYSIFAAMTAIATLQENNIPHARCVILIEASEESGSIDLEHYLEQLKEKIGTPNFVIGLDSGAGNYEQLWGTTSLRGLISGELSIRILNKGMHSGLGSGVVPSVFTIFNTLLARIENTENGKVALNNLYVDIPEERMQEAKAAAQTLKNDFLNGYTFVNNALPIDSDISELILNRTWRPALSITGIDGVPKIENAGNTTLAKLSAKLTMRLPPTLSTNKAHQILKETLETTPPFNAEVTYTPDESSKGWHAPIMADWLVQANKEASQLFFEKPAQYIGEGGSIPFMGMLSEMFPKAQFLITGVLGPLSNAHGPNEFLHIDFVKKLTGCIAYVLAMHHSTTIGSN